MHYGKCIIGFLAEYNDHCWQLFGMLAHRWLFPSTCTRPLVSFLLPDESFSVTLDIIQTSYMELNCSIMNKAAAPKNYPDML